MTARGTLAAGWALPRGRSLYSRREIALHTCAAYACRIALAAVCDGWVICVVCVWMSARVCMGPSRAVL